MKFKGKSNSLQACLEVEFFVKGNKLEAMQVKKRNMK